MRFPPSPRQFALLCQIRFQRRQGRLRIVAADLPQLKTTGVDGFFVVSAVCSADDPYAAAKELVDTWQQA